METDGICAGRTVIITGAGRGIGRGPPRGLAPGGGEVGVKQMGYARNRAPNRGARACGASPGRP